MNRYRVNIEVAGMHQVRMVRESAAQLAAHRGRQVVISDGWDPSDIGTVTAENENDAHDYWESAPRKSPEVRS